MINSMKKTALFIILLLVTLMGCSQPEKIVEDEEFEGILYSNPEAGIEIYFPSDWTPNEGSLDLITFFPDEESEYVESVSIIIKDISDSDLSLEEFNNANIDTLYQYYNNFENIASGETTLGGLPAYVLVFQGDIEGVEIKSMQIWAYRDNEAIGLAYTTNPDNYDTYLNTFMDMVNTFTFIEREIPFEGYSVYDENGVKLTYSNIFTPIPSAGNIFVSFEPVDDTAFDCSFDISTEEKVESLADYAEKLRITIDEEVESEGAYNSIFVIGEEEGRLVGTDADDFLDDTFIVMKGTTAYSIRYIEVLHPEDGYDEFRCVDFITSMLESFQFT